MSRSVDRGPRDPGSATGPSRRPDALDGQYPPGKGEITISPRFRRPIDLRTSGPTLKEPVTWTGAMASGRGLKYRDAAADRFYDFVDDVLFQPYSILRHIWRQLAVLTAMVIAGAAFFIYFQALDPLTALVASVSTISTIGFYAPPLSSMPNLEKVLLILIMIVSVGSAASMVQGVVSSVVRRELWTEDMDRRRIRRMEGHVIILGYTQIGRYVAQRLIEMGDRFCVVTRNRDNLKELQDLNIPFVFSDMKSPVDALTQANVQGASAIVLALEDDDVNMLYAMTARFMNGLIKEISVNNDRRLADGMRKAGIDVVLPIYSMVGSVAASSVHSGGILGAIFDGEGGLAGGHIVRVDVARGSGLDGAALREIPAHVVLVIRGKDTLEYLPPDFRTMAGDGLICLADNRGARLLNEMNRPADGR